MTILATMRCTECGNEFPLNAEHYERLGLKDLPKRCPACLDKRQDRPDVTLAREEVFSVVCRIGSLPAQWQEVEPKGRHDRKGWHMVIKGEQYGASWRGRIDLWAYGHKAPQIGDIVRLVEMRVTKQVAKQAWSQQTMEHGTVSGERQVPMSMVGQEGVRVVEEVRTYVRVEVVTDEESQGDLVWITAYTKTTMKGLGRQFYAHLEGEPLWHKAVSGGMRSGRARTTAWLAVVNQDNPATRVFSEGGTTERTRYPAEEAN